MDQAEDGQAHSGALGTSYSQQRDRTEPMGRSHDESGETPQTRADRIKVKDILAACEDPANLDALTSLATSTGGYLNDEVRQVACMLTNGLLLELVL